MKYDENKIDEAVLNLLYLNTDKHNNTWKGFDWQSMNRLHEKGLITNPISKAKSIYLTEEGFNKAKELFEKLFCT